VLDTSRSVPRDIKPMSEFDELLDRFKEQRATAQRILDRCDRIIRLLEEAKSTLNAPDLIEFQKQFSGAVVKALKEPARARGIVSPSEIASLAKSILRETGRPMKRGDLLAELERREVPLAGADKNKNLGTILWRHRNEFVHIEKLGYWPKDTALPGLYKPE
jgi:hypothetical protein